MSESVKELVFQQFVSLIVASEIVSSQRRLRFLGNSGWSTGRSVLHLQYSIFGREQRRRVAQFSEAGWHE